MAQIASQGLDSSDNSNTVRSRVFFWDWRALLLVVRCTAVFFQSTDAAFDDKQEGGEALVVREIIHSGNWILPLRNGVEIPSKPPLYHWLAALVAKFTHQLDEFSVRFPSALIGTLGVLLTWLTRVRTQTV